MTDLTCPQCSGAMSNHHHGEVGVYRCTACAGIFLPRADLGALSEAENDWHKSSGPQTEPLPRITPDMKAPPPSRPRARSYIETLFG